MARPSSTSKKEKELKENKIDEEKETQPKTKTKTKRQIELELRKLKGDIEVEILNISTGRCSYLNGYKKYYFSLEPGQTKSITLDELQEVCFDSKSFFTDYEVVIVDIYNDEYKLEDVLDFLSLTDIYEDIKNYDEDYIKEILLNTSDEDFNSIVGIKDKNFIKSLASKAIYLHGKGQKGLREKELILKRALGLETLFPE